ncbi:MAG: ParM/StbA family protein [Proteobacteria bacterium]|nr:ParM/StbA family protein [Pseudomonadota bacterium]
MNLKILAVDVGYSFVKVVQDEENMFLFPSFVDYQAQSSGLVLKGEEIFEIDGKTCSIGRQLRFGSHDIDPDLHGSHTWKALICKATYDLAQKTDPEARTIEVDVLSVGVPLSQFRSGKIDSLEGIKGFNFVVNGESFKVKIGNIHVWAQGFSMAQFIDFDEEETYGIVDVGHYTLDLVLFKEGKLLMDGCKSFPLGVHSVYKSLGVAFAKKANGMTLSMDRMEKLLKREKIRVRGIAEEIDMSEDIQMILASYWSSVESEVMSQWDQELNHVSQIYVGGGGAVMLSDKGVLANGLRGVAVVDFKQPVFANALGFIRFSEELMAKGADQ